MKKKNISGIQNNLQDLKNMLSAKHLNNSTSIFSRSESVEEVKKRLNNWIESHILPLINDTIDKSLDN